MDSQGALSLLNSNLMNSIEVEPEKFSELAEAVILAAKNPQGYSGFAWEAGRKLLESTQHLSANQTLQFDRFGWAALAGGIRRSIVDGRLLEGLSYAQANFGPPDRLTSVLDHPEVRKAISAAFVAVPRPFIKPSLLGSSAPPVQEEFGRLLERISEFSLDADVVLQWCAAALRVLPAHTHTYEVAAITFLNTLHNENQAYTAYYALRALAEKQEQLWSIAPSTAILQSLIEASWINGNDGETELLKLVTDDSVTRSLARDFNLMFLVGCLAIHLAKRTADSKVASMAWILVNELYQHSSLVAHVFEMYLEHDNLPTLPISNKIRIAELEHDLKAACEIVDSELRPRNYKRLANHIYQRNIEEVMQPIYEQIQSGHCSPAVITQIEQIDPVELVKDSSLQQVSPRQTGTKVVRKMISDFKKVRYGLLTAAQLCIELDRTKRQAETDKGGQYQVFWEFDTLLDELGTYARWAFRTLLPDLWTSISDGIASARQELDDGIYAER